MRIENRYNELRELAAHAERSLSKPESLAPTEAFQSLRITSRFWCYPSFDSHRSWAVFQSARNADSALVREVTWHRLVDVERLTNPLAGLTKGFGTEPTLEIKDALVEMHNLNQQMDKLKNLHISIYPVSTGIGLDGVSNGFELIGSLNSLRLSWWGDKPAEWKALHLWFEEMRQFFESHFCSKTT